MKIVQPSVQVLAYSQLPPQEILPGLPQYKMAKVVDEDPCSELARIVERCGRVSWKSEDKIGRGTADGFCTRVVNIRKDESIAEHASVTMLFVTDRYTTHQLVRHRIGSYTQESTHYINYGKRGDHIEVCEPMGIQKYIANDPYIPMPCSACSAGDHQLKHHDHQTRFTPEYMEWRQAVEHAERAYFKLLKAGVKHYHARFVLPSCLKTEIVVTYNLRIWKYVLGLRTTPNNTPEIAHITKLAGAELAKLCPEIFGESFPQEAK